MVEDRPEPSEPSPDQGRAKRPPPTIDLEALEVSQASPAQASEASGETPNEATDATPEPKPARPRGPIAALLVPALSGACAAALLIGAAWLAGWPGEAAPPPAPAVNSAGIDDLAARVAGLEAKTGKAAATDPAMAARVDGLEKSLATLRGDFATLRTQSEKLAADLGGVKSAPREAAAVPDLAAINERIAGLERAARARDAAASEQTAKQNAKSDDAPLRRIVAGALLDVLVRVGDPYPAALNAAKALAPDPDALKPLEGFAATGVPNPAVLCRELLTLVPKLSPPAQETSTTGTGLLDRLQAGAVKLVRIERTDAVGNSNGNVVARVTAAALRNDYNEARRELNTLPPAERAAAQGWIEKADARDATLAASRQFAADAMTALARPSQ